MNLIVGLVGNPNCGKTTIFNALTGGRQHVGNWPGVTVDKKSGFFTLKNQTIEVVDLPGAYSLTTVSESSSLDERIAAEFILNQKADVIVNVLDASNLERNLYLTMQLIEMRVPMVIALNMLDVARARGIQVSAEQLEKELGCKVVTLEAHKKNGIENLKKAVANDARVSEVEVEYPELIKTAARIDPHPNPLPQAGEGSASCANLYAKEDASKAPFSRRAFCGGRRVGDEGVDVQNVSLALRLLENDFHARLHVDPNTLTQIHQLQTQIRETLHEDADILIADARYRFINKIASNCIQKNPQKKSTWTSHIDNIVLNRILGIPIFLSIMYCMFFFAVNIGGAFQDFFDISSNTIFVVGTKNLLTDLHAPHWLIALLANGVGKGVNTTVTFIPVIGAMFLFLALLEDSGYMARAAFVIDRLMRALGLPGKSFVPMIVGFGCNVPAVMAARTLENKRDRILTVMMSPFMSCSARLAIYAVFTAAFFPHGGQNIVFALYMIGIVMAVFTGFLLRKTILQGESAPLVMELPSYHVPRIKSLALLAWQRLKGFVFRAGKLIVPICILLGALNTFNIDGTLNSGEGDVQSLLSYFGKWVTPIFAPMGIHSDNWPATVGLLTGVLAKEVVIGTLNTLYSQIGHAALSADTFHFWQGLQAAFQSIPANFAALTSSLTNPVLAKAPVHTLSQQVYGVMAEKFDGKIGAISYLLFVLLYFPCVSTLAAMWRELNRAWTLFSVFWTTGIAYGVAVLFYQTATFLQHPFSSSLWVVGFVVLFSLTIFGMNKNEFART